MPLTKKQRAELRLKFGGKCAYCGCELAEKGWHADHIEAVYRKWEFGPRRANGTRRTVATGEHERPENDTMDNLFPACVPCNFFKSVDSVEQFRERIATQVDVTRRASRSYRTAESFGLVLPTNAPVVFWFEKYKSRQNV